MLKQVLLPLLILFLASCGGGSASNSTASVPSTPTPTQTGGNTNLGNSDLVLSDDTINVGQSVDITLVNSVDSLQNIQWEQTSGPAVNILTPNSKMISFSPTQSGNYAFSVSYTLNNSEQTLSQSLTVSSGNAPISARIGQSVLMGSKVSLRAWLDSTSSNGTIAWQQISGPSVTLTNYSAGDHVIFFDAPNVSSDQLIVFKASVSVNGTTYSDNVNVLVKQAPTINSNAYFDTRVADVFPYNPNATYANQLVNCVYSNLLTSSCKLSTLPLIAQQTTSPTVDDIMDRVVVSHQWMADRFKAFLMNYDTHNDFKNLLRATTAIVIAYDVRPSFYWAATGAIYLDPSNLWQTPDERDTINEAPDYRSSFGNDLQFVMPWRYVKNNNYASPYFASDSRVTRTPSDSLYRLSSLLYHELSHANDFFPSTEWNAHSGDSRILDAALATDFESDQLNILYPLNSQTMTDLAQVSFNGATATDLQKSYIPSDIEPFFSPTGATDYYNYASLREDYAMEFEELMMYARYGVQRDVAITNRPTGDIIYANDYIVSWGQRGRIGEPQIKPRVTFIANHVLPEFDATSAINQLPATEQMVSGVDWVQNLVISTSNGSNIQSTEGSGFNQLTNSYQSGELSYASPIKTTTAQQGKLIMIDNLHRFAHKKLPSH